MQIVYDGELSEDIKDYNFKFLSNYLPINSLIEIFYIKFDRIWNYYKNHKDS